jgi:hypothetical protein
LAVAAGHEDQFLHRKDRLYSTVLRFKQWAFRRLASAGLKQV